MAALFCVATAFMTHFQGVPPDDYRHFYGVPTTEQISPSSVRRYSAVENSKRQGCSAVERLLETRFNQRAIFFLVSVDRLYLV